MVSYYWSLQRQSSILNFYFQASSNFKVILCVTKLTQNNLTELFE